MTFRILLILSLTFFSIRGYSNKPGAEYSVPGFSIPSQSNVIFNLFEGSKIPKIKNFKLNRLHLRLVKKLQEKFQKENPKAVSLGLALTLGIFGTHRLYLGTHHKVPVFYCLTLGGSGIILLVDIFTILTTKDLEKFKNNPKFIMW